LLSYISFATIYEGIKKYVQVSKSLSLKQVLIAKINFLEQAS
jgi:hypothetical protein